MFTEITVLTATFSAVGRSAWETLQICDRQARKDYRKIHRLLTSEEVREALQWTAAIALALGAVCFVLGQEFRSLVDRFVEASLESECEALTEEEAIAFTPDSPLAGSLPISEVVGWVSREDVAIALAEKAIQEVFADVQPVQVGGGARSRITALLERSRELQQRSLEVDAKIFTVATVAVNSMLEEADAIAARWA